MHFFLHSTKTESLIYRGVCHTQNINYYFASFLFFYSHSYAIHIVLESHIMHVSAETMGLLQLRESLSMSSLCSWLITEDVNSIIILSTNGGGFEMQEIGPVERGNVLFRIASTQISVDSSALFQ